MYCACTVHSQLFICTSNVDIDVDKETYQCSLEFFELTEVVDDAGKKRKKAIYKLCEGVTLAYAWGTSNLFNHLGAKHLSLIQRQFWENALRRSKLHTSGMFATACPPARANRITTLIAEFVARGLRPISTVDGKGFQQLLRFVEPGYKIPSRPYLTATCCRLYSSLKEQLLETLAWTLNLKAVPIIRIFVY